MANKIQDITGLAPPSFSKHAPREGSWLGSVRNAYMLDTSIGQAVMFAATANAFGVPLTPADRRLVPGYNPYLGDELKGFESFFDEFSESTSPEETAMIKQMVENNLDLRTQLEDWGGTRLFTGLLDPVNLIPVPFALGKGFAEGARRSLKVGVPIVGTTEAIRHAIDPTSTPEETGAAILAGSVFMGLIGGAVGTIPKNTMRLDVALNKLIPPAGTTSMFAGVPHSAGGSPKNLFARVTAALKSAASYGDPAWKQVDPEDVSVHIDDSFPDRKLITVRHKDGAELVTAWHVGDELQIGIEVPVELRRQGLGSFAMREALKYAENNGLIVTAHGSVSKMALQMFKGLEDQGFNFKENPNFKTDPDGTRVSTDGEPLFVIDRLIDPDKKFIPKEARDAIDDLNGQADRANIEVKILDDAIEVMTAKWKDAPTAGGAKTKAKAALRQLVEQRAQLKRDAIIATRNAQDINIKAVQMLDQQTIKDWDLLPTGYNTILGKLDQFPWWTLMKTPFRDLAPELGVKYQMFALRMASTPGLNNKGNKLGHNTGDSVENLVIEYTGRWLGATREAQRIYRVYTGHGESSGQVKYFFIDQQQRVNGKLDEWSGKDAPTETPEGKLTIREFDRQITMAIANGGKHDVPEVAKAAALYIPVLKSIADEGKKLGVFATQVNIARRITKVEKNLAEFDAKWSEKYQIGEASSLEGLDATVRLIKTIRESRQSVNGAKNNMLPMKDGVNQVEFDFPLREGGREKVTVEVLMNPTRQELARWGGREVKQVRHAVDEEGNLFVWDAESPALHDDFGSAGIDISRHGGVDDAQASPTELFDVLHREFAEELRFAETGEDLSIHRNADDSRDFFPIPNRVLDELEAKTNLMDLPELPPGLADLRNKLELEKMDLEDMAQGYIDADNPNFIHRMWLAEEVKAQEVRLKEILTREFEAKPKQVFRDADGNAIPEHPDIIRARVNETYASILHEAETGNNGAYAPDNTNSRKWLEGRKAAIEDGSYRDANGALSARTAKKQIEIIDKKLDRIREGQTVNGASGPLIARRLDLDDTELLGLNLIESDITTWMQHYVMRTAPMIETARIFGDARAQTHIDDLFQETMLAAANEPNLKKSAKMVEEAERARVAMSELRDIVHGTYQIPDNPDAITPRLLRMLRNFNILGAMGRSVLMALGDTGNIVMSQGLRRSFGYAVEQFSSGLTDGSIHMIRKEVDLAGSVSEVILGMRYHQMTDFGVAVGTSKYPGLQKFEKGLAQASQRFFLYNLLGPWTDMARRFSGGMLQSRLIENSILWKAGNLADDEITIMNRLGINREQAIQFADEWEASGSLKHKNMFIANTSEWVSEQGTRTFRAAMNNEINRMVPTPGAVDKPKALLKGEWWKVIGQYRGFSIAATHRIMGAGIHQKGMQKYAGFASMVGIAMMVDAFKRPDYIELTIEEQILRAVELSAVTGIILDVNDMVERMTAGGFGLRPALGMDIRERAPNWANRMGTIGAVPNQWLTLMYGLTSDDAETDDAARAIRYMIPYNNLIWWNSAFNRMQRSSVDAIEGFSDEDRR